MLFRFRAQQASEMGIDISTRRPKNVQSVTAVPVAEKWRAQLVKEISRKIQKINDPSLSDHQIRDINDDINRAMREKHVWELQIKSLGGPNYSGGIGSRVVDDQGKEIPGASKGYKYFGRARELPGVKELFDAAKQGPERYEKADRHGPKIDWKGVDANYYGYNLDEEDGQLLAYEEEVEAEAQEKMASSKDGKPPKGWEPLPGDLGDGVRWAVPTVEQVQEELMERKRKRLLDMLGE